MRPSWDGEDEFLEAISFLKETDPGIHEALVEMAYRLASNGVHPKGVMFRLIPAFGHISNTWHWLNTQSQYMRDTVLWELVSAMARARGEAL